MEKTAAASPTLDRDRCYRALATRDARFDGRFYTAVLSTGIYCRPICPARTPRLEHCAFYPSAAAAQAAGFRPCLRCRPEVAPGIAGWRGTANTVRRALELIAEGTLDGESDVEALAGRLGVGARHLRRLFDRHVGAPPASVAQTHRVLFAKKLVAETAMPMAEVALAAGFGSVRRFNAVMRGTFGRPPSELRRSPAAAPAASGITLRLAHTTPYDWHAMLEFLATRAIPGVEEVEAGRYQRNIEIDGACGSVAVRRAEDGGHLLATIRFPRVCALPAIVARLRRLFDLDADVDAIGAHLARDRRLTPLVASRPGLRVPGTWDAFELAVRAVLGQQVSVAAARTLASRLVAAHGGRASGSGMPLLFPSPSRIAEADLTAIGLPPARASTISGLARALVEDPGLLSPQGDLEQAIERLQRLPGIGPWTAQYIAMRALREPDAFPASDLGLLRAAGRGGRRPSPAQLLARSRAWQPWRAYAVVHLWTKDAARSERRER